MSKRHYCCPCCGYQGLGKPAYRLLGPTTRAEIGPPPLGPWYGMPYYEVCDCCGFEFGFDDEPGTGPGVSFDEYRHEWIAGGCAWFTPPQRPEDWSLERQLQAVGIEPPGPTGHQD